LASLDNHTGEAAAMSFVQHVLKRTLIDGWLASFAQFHLHTLAVVFVLPCLLAV
jgi:hypothetical protein